MMRLGMLSSALVALIGLSTPAFAGTVFVQDFESDTSGWNDSDDGWYGDVSRVASGTGGITSADGAFHALFTGDSTSAPFTRFDGYRDTWTGTWTAKVDIYLDITWGAGTGFDYSVAANGTDNAHQRDFIFHVASDTSSGGLYVAGSNNSGFATREDLDTLTNNYEVTSSGWYTFEHVFYDLAGTLAVDLNLRDSSGALLFTETRNDVSDLIPSVVGGNRYGWFTFIENDAGIAVDNTELHVVPLPPAAATGLASLGLMAIGGLWRRRRKNAA